MISQILRYFLPDQIKALVEKIESNPDASSHSSNFHRIEQLIPYMRFHERYVVRRALSIAQRSRLLDRVMEIVIDRDVSQLFTKEI